MRCVVCQQSIVDGAERFDADVHWIPAVLPPAASDEEQRRMMGVFRQRIADGDSPTVVVREMLLAGLSATQLRNHLLRSEDRSTKSHNAADRRSLFGWLGFLFAGRGTVAESREPAPDALAKARADIEKWEAAK